MKDTDIDHTDIDLLSEEVISKMPDEAPTGWAERLAHTSLLAGNDTASIKRRVIDGDRLRDATKEDMLRLFNGVLTTGPYTLVRVDVDGCSQWRCRRCNATAWAYPAPNRPTPCCRKCGSRE